MDRVAATTASSVKVCKISISWLSAVDLTEGKSWKWWFYSNVPLYMSFSHPSSHFCFLLLLLSLFCIACCTCHVWRKPWHMTLQRVTWFQAEWNRQKHRGGINWPGKLAKESLHPLSVTSRSSPLHPPPCPLLVMWSSDLKQPETKDQGTGALSSCLLRRGATEGLRRLKLNR